MPNIKLISALILNEVDTTGRVYFTRNGHCEYGILTIEQIDELDRYRAAYLLHSKLKKAAKEGYMSNDEINDIIGEVRATAPSSDQSGMKTSATLKQADAK